jgi:3-mercaptopyruvate sulfurtransferase SseA
VKIMRSFFISTAATLALAAALLSACKPHDTSASASNATASQTANAAAHQSSPSSANAPAAAQQAAAPNDDVARIKQDELTAGLKKGTVALFDVRDKPSYEAGHIKGAKNVPWGEVEQRLSEFPKDKQIVTYCA